MFSVMGNEYNNNELDFLFELPVELPEKKVTANTKKFFENVYKKLYAAAYHMKEPSLTASYNFSEVSKSSGGVSDRMGENVAKKLDADKEIGTIIETINKMHVLTSIPDEYYRDLLFIKYIDPKYFNYPTYHLKQEIARRFPNRVGTGDKTNEYELDDHIYYKDLKKAELAFAEYYKNRVLKRVDITEIGAVTF